jgi:hypothetical protein
VILSKKQKKELTHHIWEIGYLNRCYQLKTSFGINKQTGEYYINADNFYTQKGYSHCSKKDTRQLLEQEDVFKTLTSIIDEYLQKDMYICFYSTGEMAGKISVGELHED